MRRRLRTTSQVIVGVALALGSIAASPPHTPTPTPTPTPRITPTPIVRSPTPTSGAPTPAPTPGPPARPVVFPDLPVASVRWLPLGNSPLAAHPWRTSDTLQAAIESAVSRHQGSISVVATNLDTGATASVNADEQLSSASLYKLFLLQAAYAQMSTGALGAQDQLTLGQTLADSDPYTDLAVGTRSSVGCALQTMIEISSNSAADMIEDRLGDAAVNAYLVGLGLQKSYITPDHAYTSAADIARLLNGMALGQAVSPLASSQMLSMLLAQQENNRLPVPLPIGIPVAHKTGELTNLRHDAGVIYAPSGAYLLVALVGNAPDEAAARDAIVDISRTAYSQFGPAGAPHYLGLAPRLAEDVFRVPDAQGRLPVLLDRRTDTVLVGPLGIAQQNPDDQIRLRQETVADLHELQVAAAEAGFPFWVLKGWQPPNDSNMSKVLRTAFVAPCQMDVPPPPPLTPTPIALTPTPGADVAGASPTPAPSPARVAPQAWLGTVVEVADDPATLVNADDDRDSETVQWLEANAWQYGFVPALPETDAGAALGHEPWTFRWVGRPMAAELQPVVQFAEYAALATRALQRAEDELASQAQADDRGVLIAGMAEEAARGP
ncbi:MAG: serine hydrolase [Chloroflexi bacterium]|nr:serine hydrolase [Chloroflexota bacterium]